MENTVNYNLKKPGIDDFYDVQDFNDNADIIDTALKSHDTQLAQKADRTELLTYEEGIFTPVLKGATVAGNNLYDSAVGTYVVIGDMVFANFVISLSTKDSNMSGAVLIGGLPFPANFSVSSVLFSRIAFLDYTNDAKELKTASLANDIVLRFVTDNADTLNVDSSLVKNTTNLFGTFAYKR